MYLFFNLNQYLFAFRAILVKKVLDYREEVIKDNILLDENREYKVFEGKFFLKLNRGEEGQKKNILLLNSKKGLNIGLLVDIVEGFFEVDKLEVINKAGLLNKYGYQYIDFSVTLGDRIIFAFYDEFLDERYKELTCQK